jgi:hypothetical protein
MENPIRALLRNIYRLNNATNRTAITNGRHPACLPFVLFVLTTFLVSGCGPKYTYPASEVTKSVEKICRDEYGIKTDSRVTGKTLGAVFYMDNVLDAKGQLAKEVHEQMGKVMQVLTRVALSTDLPLDYCTVLLRDRVFANELVITRSVDDTKRANAEMIGIEESINRTVFGQRSFQAAEQKQPFALKEITQGGFLAEQIVQRVRYQLSKDPKDETNASLLLMDGAFDAKDGNRTLRFSYVLLKPENPKKMLLDVFHQAAKVIDFYKFKNYDKIEVLDYMNRQRLSLKTEEVDAFIAKKLSDNDLMARHISQSASVQEAFKLFGFSPPPVNAPDEAAVTVAEAAR